MSERQQPDLSTTEGTSYRRKGGGRRTSEPRRGSGVGRQIGVNLVIAVLVAGLALAGWFIANQQQMLIDEQSKSAQANTRLEKLEARLVATDSAMAQEGVDTKEQIGFWESEIRKLWAVSNDRNKNWIQDNQATLKKIDNSLSGIEAANRDLKAAVGRHESAFEQQQALVDQLTGMELQMQQVIRGQRDLVDKVNAANQTVASLRAQLADKVDDNAEAIQAIDAFRVAINSRIADLERRLVAGAPGG